MLMNLESFDFDWEVVYDRNVEYEVQHCINNYSVEVWILQSAEDLAAKSLKIFEKQE